MAPPVLCLHLYLPSNKGEQTYHQPLVNLARHKEEKQIPVNSVH